MYLPLHIIHEEASIPVHYNGSSVENFLSSLSLSFDDVSVLLIPTPNHCIELIRQLFYQTSFDLTCHELGCDL